MSTSEEKHTEVGSYFVANYPPFSVWGSDAVATAHDAIARPPAEQTELGLYLHIPFCRKRCKFCYYRVYTDKNKTERDLYLESLAAELKMYAESPVIGGRPLDFIYVGGGTPSALNEDQYTFLGNALREHFDWSQVREVTFECEPGTLTESKVESIREFGVSRLSLGVENFSDAVLEENGRAHLSGEIYKAWEWIQAQDFAHINIDLIAGMVGETDANWSENIQRTIDLSPDCVTIYQMELPYNTVYSKSILNEGAESPIAGWETKRRWVSAAFARFAEAGYVKSSAYTVVKKSNLRPFLYRDALWRGADLIGAGVASFGHIQGVHVQNLDRIEDYQSVADSGKIPLARAYQPTPQQALIREMILQLKTGHIEAAPFQEKFGVDILDAFGAAYAEHERNGMLRVTDRAITLTDDGLLRVDSLLPAFYEEEHRDLRYT